MNHQSLFSILNLAAMVGWCILIFAPRGWRWLGMLPRFILPGALALVYVALMGAGYTEANGGFGSIAQVRALFGSDSVLVAGWGHYLAFDLIVGTLLAERMDRVGITRWLQAPILIATFMFGPLGWLLAMGTEAALQLGKPTPRAEGQS
jgi:hypothetical protein